MPDVIAIEKRCVLLYLRVLLRFIRWKFMMKLKNQTRTPSHTAR
jgi:hypothetical protein